MVDIKHKHCVFKNCTIRPSYNFHGNKPLYCDDHKEIGMINVTKHKICIEENCNKTPTYNFKDNTAIYCLNHKKNGMIDVNHKTCIEPNCCVRPSYNFENNTPLYCTKHKSVGMVEIYSIKCNYKGCLIKPSYNFHGNKPIYCGSHKLDGMINIYKPKCKTPLCSTILSNTDREYCIACFIHIYPNTPVMKNYKTKEKEVVDRIKEKFPNFDWKYDKIIQDGCSKKRPDLLLDMGINIIIVEIDENKHSGYDCICENKRLMEISQDLQHRPIVCIRFNPDSYTDFNGKIKSCWKINKMGIMQIEKNKKNEWENRIKCLIQEIDYWINNSTEKTIEIIQLFY